MAELDKEIMTEPASKSCGSGQNPARGVRCTWHIDNDANKTFLLIRSVETSFSGTRVQILQLPAGP